MTYSIKKLYDTNIIKPYYRANTIGEVNLILLQFHIVL